VICLSNRASVFYIEDIMLYRGVVENDKT